MKLSKRILCFTFFSLLGACQGTRDGLTQDKAFDLTLRAIQHYQLSELSKDCLDFEEKNTPQFYAWVVKEKQSANCGGDPRINSRFFEIRTDRQTGKITSDAKSIPGNFISLE